MLDRERITRHLQLSAVEGRLRAQLYERGQILQESVDEQGNWILKVELPASEWHILDKQENLSGHIIAIDQKSSPCGYARSPIESIFYVTARISMPVTPNYNSN